MALTKVLNDRGVKAQYTAFDQKTPDYVGKKNLPNFSTTVEQSCEMYISLKLGSSTVGKWVMKTPFFKSLLQMLPSLGHMILLGHYIKSLEDDPELVIVLDSPSTGHARSMFESTKNFKDIFKLGVLVDDINKMNRFLFSSEDVKIIVSSIASEMSLQEALELESYLSEKGHSNLMTTLNNSLFSSMQISAVSDEASKKEKNPLFLETKLKNEETIIDQFIHQIKHQIPKIFSHEQDVIIDEMEKYMDGIL